MGEDVVARHAVLQQGVVAQQAEEVAAQGGQGHLDGEAFGRVGEEAYDAEGLGGVAQGEGLGELEGGVVAAHAHVLFHVLDVDAGAVFGQDLAEFLDGEGQFLEVGAGRFGEEGGGVGGDAESLLGDEAVDPAGDFVVGDGVGLEGDADLFGVLIEGGAFVDVLAGLGGVVVGLVADHQHGRGLDALEVHADVLHFLHHLGFLDDHELPGDHHGELAGGAHHLVRGHVGPEVHELSEVAFLGRDHLFHQ